MKEVPLSRGLVAFVDDADWPLVCDGCWSAAIGGKYASRFLIRPDGTKAQVLMHRHIVNAPKGFEVDHVDGNGLNNCRANLRIATHRENMGNIHTSTRTRRGELKGVFLDKRRSSWVATLRDDAGRKRFLGQFSDEYEAALAYDAAARERFGEFANPNFKTDEEAGATSDYEKAALLFTRLQAMDRAEASELAILPIRIANKYNRKRSWWISRFKGSNSEEVARPEQ